MDDVREEGLICGQCCWKSLCKYIVFLMQTCMAFLIQENILKNIFSTKNLAHELRLATESCVQVDWTCYSIERYGQISHSGDGFVLTEVLSRLSSVQREKRWDRTSDCVPLTTTRCFILPVSSTCSVVFLKQFFFWGGGATASSGPTSLLSRGF